LIPDCAEPAAASSLPWRSSSAAFSAPPPAVAAPSSDSSSPLFHAASALAYVFFPLSFSPSPPLLAPSVSWTDDLMYSVNILLTH